MASISCFNNPDFCNDDAAVIPELTCSHKQRVCVQIEVAFAVMCMMLYYLFKICPI